MAEADAPERSRRGVRCVVGYHGGGFHGFQRQPSVRTVQGVLDAAVARLDADASMVRGASRTDAGVHARGQVVAFDTGRDMPPMGWRMQLNRALPDDVAVHHVDLVDPGYEPRFDAVRKEYRYRLRVGPTRDPLRDAQCWAIRPQHARRGAEGPGIDDWLDVDAMREAAAALIGTHDFRAFRSADDTRENTVRTVERLDLVVTPLAPDELTFVVVGNAFMKNMVRILVGTLVEVGRTKRGAASVGSLLGPDGRREQAGITAPAEGLCLHAIELGRGNWAPSPAADTVP